MVPIIMIFHGNINRFFINSQFFRYLIIFFSLFNLSLCLYEDQVGKFDWRQNYVGKIKFASFDMVSKAKNIIIATEENVIAALNSKTGQIIWRKVLEKGHTGRIRAFKTVDDGKLISVSGGVPAIVRYWNLATGHILNEWPLAEQNPDRIDSPFISYSSEGLYSNERIKDVQWHIKGGTLHHILPIYNSGVEVTSYDSKTGEKLKTRKISAPFISQETECILASPYFFCLKGDNNLAILFYIDIFEPNSQPQSITINTIFGAGAQGPYHISLVPGNTAAISISTDNNRRKRLLLLEDQPLPIPRDIDGDNFLYITDLNKKKVVLESSYNNGATTITAIDLNLNLNEIQSEKLDHTTHSGLYKPEIFAADCTYQSARGNTCSYLLSSEDHSISVLKQKVIWTREEALARITAVEIIELPMSDRDQAIETEFDLKERDIFGMLIRRLSSQANQIKAFVQTIFGMESQQSNQRADLVRDKFGLHKMIVAVTLAGKIFGIESKKGELIWQLRVPNIQGFSKDSNMILYVQRGSRHFPHPPQCSLLAASKDNGYGVIFTFNPINGQPLDGLTKLNYRVKQSILLHVATDTFLRSIVILDERDRVHVYPESATSVAASVGRDTYIFTVDRLTGVLSGYSLSYSMPQNLVAYKMNRHHYALFIRNCRLILLLRRDFTEGDPDMFRPAEWRWKLAQVCDDRWHHYAIQVNFPRVSLFVDGEEWHADKMNPEIIDDWPLHPAKGINTTLVVGACWQGSDNKTKHYFRGYLAGLSVLVGRNEKPDVLSCLRHCQEGIHVPSMDLLQPGTQLLTNSDLTELRIDGDNRTNVETLLRRIGYTNSRKFPTPGRRNFRLDTTVICEGREDRPLNVPSIQSYVFVLPPPRPGITVNGTGYIAREYADFRLGVAVFPDVHVTAGSASRLDACAVSVYPSLNPDHESLSLPGDTLRRFHSISARVDRDGVVLSGADTPHNYQQIIRFITYANRKPAYYLDRVFKITCSELSGRFASNEYVQTLAVIHPKEKSTSTAPTHPTHSPNDIPMARIVEPQPGHALLSPHHAELNQEYATTQIRDNIHSVGGSHAVTIVAACCIAFLLLMVVVGAARVRGANRRRRSAGEELAAETEMAWDDSALAITVNPMDRLTEQDGTQGRREEEVDDSESSDSEDGSFRDDDLDTSDCENECDLGTTRRHGRSSTPDYEWDNPNV